MDASKIKYKPRHRALSPLPLPLSLSLVLGRRRLLRYVTPSERHLVLVLCPIVMCLWHGVDISCPFYLFVHNTAQVMLRDPSRSSFPFGSLSIHICIQVTKHFPQLLYTIVVQIRKKERKKKKATREVHGTGLHYTKQP